MNWLINASVWIQAPLVVAVLLLFAVAASRLLNALFWLIFPPDAEEKYVLGLDGGNKAAEDPAHTEQVDVEERLS